MIYLILNWDRRNVFNQSQHRIKSDYYEGKERRNVPDLIYSQSPKLFFQMRFIDWLKMKIGIDWVEIIMWDTMTSFYLREIKNPRC